MKFPSETLGNHTAVGNVQNENWVTQVCLGLVASLLLAACATQPAERPIIIQLSTVTPSPLSAATSKPTATGTRRPIPTIPTASGTPSATPVPPTPDILGTLVAGVQPELYDSHLSPDGQWRAEVIIYDCTPIHFTHDYGLGSYEYAYEQLKLIGVSSGVEAVVDSQLLYCGGLGASGLAGLYWSTNSRYFYYTDAREGVPDGCGYWERSIIRLDITDQTTESLGAGPLSPDGSKLATWQLRELVVWHVNGGEIARTQATTANAERGPITWALDSQALVYVQFESYCPLSGKSNVVRLDLPELAQTLLLESEKPTFGSAIWDVPDELRLFDEMGREWRYIFATKELVALP